MFRSMRRQTFPYYTARMLLNHAASFPDGDLVLKKYSHFSLACTNQNESLHMVHIFEQLTNVLKKPIVLSANEVINLGNREKPLWALALNFGDREVELRMLFSTFFDPLMCTERNGTLYLWWPDADEKAKCPHITIGPQEADQQLAYRLMDAGQTFIFDQMDYKLTGPQNPLVSRSFHSEECAPCALSI